MLAVAVPSETTLKPATTVNGFWSVGIAEDI
jgi:hypothetical protein